MKEEKQKEKDISNINYIPMQYNESLKILKKMASLPAQNGKTMFIFAGANGSGKSTLIANLYKQGKLGGLPYINADMELLNAEFKANIDEKTKQKKIAIKTFDKVKHNIEQYHSFVYETVFSDIGKIELVSFANAHGYKIEFIHVKTDSPDINEARVLKRVAEGGHSVPREKIYSRWFKSEDNIAKIWSLCDNMYVFNNSKEKTKTNDLCM